MKRNVLQLVVASFLLLPFTTAMHAQTKQDSINVQHIINEERDAWNKGDAVAYSKYFAEDGTFTNILGMFYKGKKIFEERHDQIFKGVFRGTVLQKNIVAFRFVHRDVAVIETLGWVSNFQGGTLPPGMQLDTKGRLVVRLLQVLVRDKNSWKITAYHNVDVKPGTPVPEPE